MNEDFCTSSEKEPSERGFSFIPDHQSIEGVDWPGLDADDMSLFPDNAETDFLEDPDDENGFGIDDLFEHYRVVADPGQSPLRVDKFLMNRMQHTSRNRIQMAANEGGILVNGKPVKSNFRIKANDVISVMIEQPKRDYHIVPEEIPLDIAYEDEYLLVVNKPAGLVVHPGSGNYSGTLVHALAYYLKDDPLYDPNAPTVGLVHRIDKDTSGLLLVAKRPYVKTHLSRQFYNKTTGREYQALVWGRVDPPTGTIEGNIIRDPSDRTRMTVLPPSEEIGKSAITHYRVIEPLGFVTLVECKLETGRTHQIRAHMRSIGHPLFADTKYGGNRLVCGNRTAKYLQFVNNCLAICPRQALHAQTLRFEHPITHQEISLSTPIPQDMQDLLQKWRRYVQEAQQNIRTNND